MKNETKVTIGSSLAAGALLALAIFAGTPSTSTQADPTPTPTPTPEAPLTVEFGDNFTSATLTAISLHQSAQLLDGEAIVVIKDRMRDRERKIEALVRALEFQDDVAAGFGYDILEEQ